MMNEHIESYLSACVCVFVCVFQNRVRIIPSLWIVGFNSNLGQIIIMTRGCVAYKNHVDRSKFKVTVYT